MSPVRRTVLFVAALAIGLLLAVALVRAATPGQDFEWLSVSEGGIRIGAVAGEGEGPVPLPNTLEFAPAPNGAGILFHDSGMAVAVDASYVPKAYLALLAGESPTALLLSQDTAMMSGRFESGGEGEGEGTYFVPGSSIICAADGDVIVRLAYTGESQGAQSLFGDAPTPESRLAATLEYILSRLPIRWPAER